MRIAALAPILLLAAALAPARAEPPSPTAKARMARLSPLVGKWRGSAWMAMPVWMLAGPAGPKRRFTIQVEDDRWVEAGEISHDGATWKPFFEMTLARVK